MQSWYLILFIRAISQIKMVTSIIIIMIKVGHKTKEFIIILIQRAFQGMRSLCTNHPKMPFSQNEVPHMWSHSDDSKILYLHLISTNQPVMAHIIQALIHIGKLLYGEILQVLPSSHDCNVTRHDVLLHK